ncbi:MAG: DUF502 domain-containing protein [Elusimicrobiota bacterium]
MIKKISNIIKNRIIAGIIVILPLGLTAWIVWILFRFFGKRFLPLFKNFPTIANLPMAAQMAISAVLTIVSIWIFGVFAKNFIGKILLRWFEKLILTTPVVSKIYKTIRQITDTMFVNKKAFKRVALIEYPRKGLYTMVFVTNEVSSKSGEEYITVFVPSTPNPTTGYCMILPKEDVYELSITVNQAMEFIFSGGILVPENFRFKKIE